MRESDKMQIDGDLRRIFTSETKEDALARLSSFKEKWNKKYPRQIYNIEKKVINFSIGLEMRKISLSTRLHSF